MKELRNGVLPCYCFLKLFLEFVQPFFVLFEFLGVGNGEGESCFLFEFLDFFVEFVAVHIVITIKEFYLLLSLFSLVTSLAVFELLDIQ